MPKTEEQKLTISTATKEAMWRPEVRIKMESFYNNKRGSKWVSNDKVSIQIRPEDVQLYLNNGYHLGRKKGGGNNE